MLRSESKGVTQSASEVVCQPTQDGLEKAPAAGEESS